MTYKQIEQIEGFIKEVNELKENTAITDRLLYERGQTLHEKFSASNIGYLVAIDWDKCSLYMYDSDVQYYPEHIQSNFEVMLSALQGILNAIPQYPYILEVRKDIKEGRNVKDSSAKRRFVTEISIKYQGRIDFGKNVQQFVKESEFPLVYCNLNAICEGVIQRLSLYLNELFQEHKTEQKKTQSKQTVVNVNQNVSQNQETNVNVAISFEDCFKALDDCETLNDTETLEIKAQLEEIQELLKDKKGKKKTIKQKIGSILKWVGDKGTDVMIAILPIVLQNLQGLQ